MNAPAPPISCYVCVCGGWGWGGGEEQHKDAHYHGNFATAKELEDSACIRDTRTMDVRLHMMHALPSSCLDGSMVGCQRDRDNRHELQAELNPNSHLGSDMMVTFRVMGIGCCCAGLVNRFMNADWITNTLPKPGFARHCCILYPSVTGQGAFLSGSTASYADNKQAAFPLLRMQSAETGFGHRTTVLDAAKR